MNYSEFLERKSQAGLGDGCGRRYRVYVKADCELAKVMGR